MANELQIEDWDSLGLENNFIFYKVMRHHPDACKHLIELLLEIDIEKLELSNEETIFTDPDSHGIRLDVYVKDTNQVFDIEMQTSNTGDLPERARYYQGIMDVDTLKASQQYKEMKDSHVIFICMKNIFKNKLPVYTFENICTEDGKTKLKDRAYKHFFIVPNCAKLIEDNPLKKFCEFLISKKASDDFTGSLSKYVTNAKHTTEWRRQYMTWERQRAYDHEAGFKEGIAKGASETARKNAEILIADGRYTMQEVSKLFNIPESELLAMSSSAV